MMENDKFLTVRKSKNLFGSIIIITVISKGEKRFLLLKTVI